MAAALPAAALALAWLIYALVAPAQADNALQAVRYRMHRALGGAQFDPAAPLPDGLELNQLAWRRSYEERGLPVPASGPRDGYWGRRLPQTAKHPVLGWHTGAVHLPGLWESGELGVQRVASAIPGHQRLLILGGSVAEGAYASSTSTVYFARLAALLARGKAPVSITIIAGGAWTSVNELAALKLLGLQQRPDVVLFLDGLNDLALDEAQHQLGRRLKAYLDNLRQALDLLQASGADVVLAPQPALHDKRHRSAVEDKLLRLTNASSQQREHYQRLRQGQQRLARRPRVHFVDCSGVFDSERATTMADGWHFSDPGHELLAQHLSRGLLPILLARRGAAARGGAGEQ